MIIFIPGADMGCGLLSVLVHKEGSSVVVQVRLLNNAAITSIIIGRLFIAPEPWRGRRGNQLPKRFEISLKYVLFSTE